ncbi:unnamed protein product [Effrenium voratum]|nr:unnamed protein product [Effrenium voratum]
MSGRANHEEVEPPGLEPEEGGFWQLHRQLADCYVADIAKLGKRVSVSMPPCSPPEMLFEQDRRDSIDSHFRTSKSNKKDTLKPPSRAPSIENPKSSETPTVAQRKDRTLKTLLNVQGLQPTASETFDLRELDLKVHERWDAARAKQQKHFAKKSLEDGRSKTQAMQPVMTVAEELPRRRCVLHPGGRFKTCWNVMVAACVLHDLLVIPLNTFSFPQNVFWDLTSWSVQVFWNLDFFVSLFSAFYDEGALVMSLPRIAAQYARTWMLFDVTMISMDWCFRIMDMVDSEQAESIMWSKSLRMLRFLRLMRMLRWVKLRRINEIFQEFFHSQAASLYYGLFHSIATLMVLNHLIACAWFATSHMDEMNWVTDLGIHNDPAEYQYLTCMNWAFAQLGVGSSPAKATNSLEMVFCIVIAFRSLITSSTLISTVSNLMAGLSKIKEDENTEFRLLRCYLAQNNIPIVLGQKITHFLQYQYTLRQEARSADMQVPLLELLSQQLQGELQFARYEESLAKLRLVVELLESGDRQVVHTLWRVAVQAVGHCTAACKDLVFLAGNQANAAYLKLNGMLTYSSEDGDMQVNDSGWVSEACLWTPWVYLGDLIAEDVSRLAALDAEAFGDAMSQCYQTQRAASKYAPRRDAAARDLVGRILPGAVHDHHSTAQRDAQQVGPVLCDAQAGKGASA